MKCKICNGSGYVLDPFWVSVFEKSKNPSEQFIKEEWENWRRVHGLDYNEPIPAEEKECEHCSGRGYYQDMFEALFYRFSNKEEYIDINQARKLFSYYLELVSTLIRGNNESII